MLDTGQGPAIQTNHVYSTLKRRGNDRFHVVSTWDTRVVFVGWIRPWQSLQCKNFMTKENLRMKIVTFFYSKDFEQKKLSWKKKKKDLNRRLIYGIG